MRIETLVTEDYLGRGGTPAPPTTERGDEIVAPVPVEVEVVWGDVTQVRADIYSVGHYRGVLPQRAELALDRALSGPDRQLGVIVAQTQRGLIRADVGDISMFPWLHKDDDHRIIAVVGMGQPGSFDATALRRCGPQYRDDGDRAPRDRGLVHRADRVG